MKSLYEVLESSKSDPDETIRSNYRRLALQCHPDHHPDREEQWHELSRAYEVLGNPSRRPIYDKFGPQGLAFFENAFVERGDADDAEIFLPFVNLVTSNTFRIPFFFFLLIIITCLICIPTFFAIKIDGIVQWPWYSVFIPVWILHFLGTLIGCSKPVKPPAGIEQELNIEDTHQASPQVFMFRNVSLVAFEIILVLYLSGVAIEPIFIFVPIFVLEAFNLIHLAWKFATKCGTNRDRDTNLKLVRTCYNIACRIVMWTLVSLKVTQLMTISYMQAIAVPLIVMIGGDWLVFTCCLGVPVRPEDRTRSNIFAAGCCQMIFMGMFITSVVLCVSIADGTLVMPVTNALIPIFIFAGLSACGVCCMSCALCAPRPAFDHAAAQSHVEATSEPSDKPNGALLENEV